MTLKEFEKLKGDELLVYNGNMPKKLVEQGEIFKIVDVRKHLRRINIDLFMFRHPKFNWDNPDDIKELREHVEAAGEILGGTICVERLDGKDMAICDWVPEHRYYKNRRYCDYRMLKVYKGDKNA